MNLKHLSYFVDISKRESFTKAADDIYVSQSALSKSVKSLEQELNVTLIDRTSKSFNLTEEGRILYVEGEKLLQYIDESQDEISRFYFCSTWHVLAGSGNNLHGSGAEVH